MIIPADSTIEEAVDSLKQLNQSIRDEQRRQLRAALGIRASEEFENGYELGLQTARMLVANGPAPGATEVDL
jgi:hypothetical protein